MNNNYKEFAHFDTEATFNEIGKEASKLFKKADLSDKEHIVFSSFWTGLSSEIIARELDLSVDAVKKRIQRARRKLQRVLSPSEILD